MQSFSTFLEESETQPYHNKKLKISTSDFEGHAHIKHSRSIGRKHTTHEYRVTYKGKMSDGRDADYSKRMVVKHGNDGKPYEHAMDGSRSASVTDLIKKNTPKFVSIHDLQPK